MHFAAKAFFGQPIYVIFFFLFVFSGSAVAQSNATPADSTNRNLFTGSNAASSLNQADSAEKHLSDQLIPNLKENIARYPFYYLYIFFGCAVLLAIIRLISPSYLRELLLSVLNLKLLLNIFKEGRFDWNFNNFLLDVVCVLMLSIGIQQSFFAANPHLFIWILAFTATAYFIKLILIQLLANIFFGRGEALVHLLMHTLFMRILGLILHIVLFTGLYQTVFPLPQLLQNISYLLAVSYIIWVIRLYVKMKSISTGEMFYLFLYLCTIEVSPIIILLKEVIV